MAYYCTMYCDVCGDSNITAMNMTVSKTRMEKDCRKMGWKHNKKKGWVCPECQRRYLSNLVVDENR